MYREKAHCPQCGKPFNDHFQVQRHLDQPRTRCHRSPVAFADTVDLIKQLQSQPNGQRTERTERRFFRRPHRHAPRSPPRDLRDSSIGPVDPEEQVTDYYPHAAKVVDQQGSKFMDAFDQDSFAHIRRHQNLYYPFADRPEWELAEFLVTSALSMAAIDRFLSLPIVKQLQLSFTTAKQLRGFVEMLPQTPPWKCRHVNTAPHETKTIPRLFYRDTVDCLQLLLSNPLIADSIDFTPYRVFTTAERLVRIYTEWMSGDIAWNMQKEINIDGASVLGIILSSDKTNVTNQTGGKVSHPLLMSLANIHSEVRNKASRHAFLPIAFLPVVKFIHTNKRMRSVLSDRLYHQCLDIVAEPLKIAARIGIMLSDPLGYRRYCFTPLASCIVDMPEACLIACVRGKTSPVTLADYTQFGDPVRHKPRTKAVTLHHLESIDVEPNDLVNYFEACGKYRLNGVAFPYWRDWALSNPAFFLTPEMLHTFIRFGYDHELNWCIHTVGAAEIDYRFSIIQPVTNHRHFPTGVTKLNQVTGKISRDIQRYLVAVIAGAAPDGVIRAVRALAEFRYLAQSHTLDDDQCRKLSSLFQEFHAYKQRITEAGARCGEKGNIIEHWEIPKLELMHAVAPSVPLTGNLIQWSADTTERAHIDFVKNPATATNNNDFESQICRYLDRHEKCRTFSLALHIRENENRVRDSQAEMMNDNDSDWDDVGSQHEEDAAEQGDGELLGQYVPRVAPRPVTDYFASSAKPHKVSPPRTFISGPIAFHLGYAPAIGSMQISDVADKFNLPDLRVALVHYFYRTHGDRPLTVGGQRPYRVDASLPFDRLQVWYKVRLQQKTYHDPTTVRPAQTLNASPAKAGWPKGRYDAAFVNVDHNMVWPQSGLKGHIICEIRLIFRPIPPKGGRPCPWWCSRYLTYVSRLDIVPVPGGNIDEVVGMHVVKRVNRANGTSMGDVIPLSQLRALAPLVPKFGRKANSRLTAETSSWYSQDFYLNRFFEKELYYALQS